MNRLFLVCALISLFCRFANANGGGAPTDACKTMKPKHGVEPQTTKSPFMIQVDKAYYNENSMINVTVKANGSDLIKGILIQAREMGKDKPLGGFTIKPEKTKNLDCTSDGAENVAGAITHSEPLAAKMLTFQWEPTSMTTGNITFMATIVQTRTIYWVGVKSAEVQDKTARETVKTTPKDTGATSIAASSVMVTTTSNSTRTGETTPNDKSTPTSATTPNDNSTPTGATTPNDSSTPTGAMETTTKDGSGAISNVTNSIALLILVISAKLFI